MKDRAKRIYVLVSNDLYTDQRVQKVCVYLTSLGFEPVLLGRLFSNSGSLDDRKYATKRFRLLFNKGPLFYANLNLVFFFYLLFRKTPWILSNDLDTLLCGFLVSKIHPKSQLVYDSHEFFTGVPELQARPKVQKIWLGIEKWIFPKLEKVYTVNQSIAKKYESLYGKKLTVLRNIAPYRDHFEKVDLSRFQIREDAFLIILQGAGINVDRGAEEAVEAMQFLEGCQLLILGSGDALPNLKVKVADMHLSEKVKFGDKMPYDELLNFTHCAQLGLSLDKANNLNYQLSLPNKVFDYLQAETPVLASSVVEIAALFERYPFGTTVESVTPKAIASCIQDLIDHPEKLEVLKQNCKKFKAELCWEKEVQQLNAVYEN